MDCIFCKIINKEIESKVVYEDEYVVAFHDINKEAPVHILFVPKVHISNINDITSENSIYVAKIYEAIAKVAKQEGISERGYRVISNTLEDGGQTIMHLHYHLVGGKKLGIKIL